MSNYRVRQVLVLGDAMPRRQLRFLVALATYLGDDSRRVRVGFDALTATAGLSARWMKVTRGELRDGGQIEYQPGKHRGDLTLWTALCLPEKGAPMGDPLSTGKKGGPMGDSFLAQKGAPDGAERGHLTAEKGGTLKLADQQEPDCGLNRRANPSSSLSRALTALAAAVPDLTEREIESISDRLKDNPEIPYPGRYLQVVIGNGDAAEFAAAVLNGHDRRGRHGRQADTDAISDRAREAAEAADGPRSEACKRPVHSPRDCGYRWCTCTCHKDRPREQLDDALPLAAITAGIAEHQDAEAGPTPMKGPRP